MNSPPPKLEVILTNFFAEPTVLLVPITSRVELVIELREGLMMFIDVQMYISLYKNANLHTLKYNICFYLYWHEKLFTWDTRTDPINMDEL